MRLYFACTVTLVLLIMLLGCSSSGSPATAPDLTSPGSLDFTAQTEQVNSETGHTVLWGLWDVSLDPLTGQVETVPIRGAQWTVDVTMFLQPPAGTGLGLIIDFGDTSEWLTLGHLPVDVTLIHPFPGLAQFTGADVRGVFITTGDQTMNYDTDLVYTDFGVNSPWLANPDGYTRWMNPVEFADDGTLWTNTPGALGLGSGFDATMNPCKYFCDGLGSEDDLYDFFSDPGNLANRGQFTSASQNTRLYDLYFPLTGPGGEPEVVFQYAVIASWAEPTDLDPGDLPGSFPPEANTEEAFMAVATDAGGTLYYTSGEAGGDMLLDIEIFDWGAFLGASGAVLDDIGRIVIESPQGILPSPYVEFDVTTLAATAVPGSTDASSIVTIEILDCLPTDVEGQMIIIGIEDASVTYDNYGFGTVYPDAPLTSYFIHTLDISNIVPETNLPDINEIIPDHGLPDTYLYDCEVIGENLGNVTELKLVGNTTETTAVNLVIVDDEHLAFELDLDGMDLGLYDVVAHDPVYGDGTLEDGFEVMDCPTGIHNSLQLYTTTQSFSPLFVAGLLNSGTYSGQTVTQWGHAAWTKLNVADPPADNTPSDYWCSKPSLDPYYNDWSWSMDMDKERGFFAYTTFDDDDSSGSWPNTSFDFVKICNQEDGSYNGACDTECGYAVAQVDFDEYGNVWAVCSNAYYPNFGFTLQRWDYDPGAPAPHYTFVDEYDISGIISGTRVISDIVVLQRYRRLYISRSPNSGWGVHIDCWDISTDPPTWLNNATTTATGFYGTNSFQEVHQRFVDMEVDRTDDVLAGCRILLMFMGRPSVDRTLELRKYDLDLNLIASSALEFNFGFNCWFSNFVVDDEHDGRVVCIYDRFTLPPPGHIGVAEAPADW